MELLKKIPIFIIFLLGLLLMLFSILNVFYLFNWITFLFCICACVNSLFLFSAGWYFLKNTETLSFKKSNASPLVAIVCTCSGEDEEIVKKTLDSMGKIRYKNKNLYLLDDSKGGSLQKYCKGNKIQYITRKNRENFKAGNLNNFLFNYCKEDYLLIFDKDDFKLVDPNIINELLPFFEDKKIAYIQTKKTTIHGSLFENAIKETNSLFYNLIQPINNKADAALFGGSLALMDTRILKKLGGFPNYLIEDIAYSFNVLFKGYKGKYINKSYVLSYKIENFSEFQKQQFRYNFSNTELLLKFYLKNFFKIPLRLHKTFILQFLGLHFLSLSQSISAIFLVFFILFLPFFYYNILILFVFLFPLAVLIFSKEYTNSYKIGIVAYLLNQSLIFTRLLASFKAVLYIKPINYGVTGIGKEKIKLKEVIKRSYLEIICFIVFLTPLFFVSYNPAYYFLIIWNASLFLTTPLFLHLFG